MKKISCFLFALFSFYGISYAQNHDAELFFKDGTSLTGYAMLHKNDQIKFRLTLDAKPDIWTELMVEKITFFFLDFDVTFKYIKIKSNKSPQLLKIVTYGNVTLFARIITKPKYIGGNISNRFNGNYYYTSKNWETSHNITKYYVQRNNEKFPTLISRNFKKNAKIYFPNCIGLIEKLNTGEFRYFTMSEMVEYYNSYCTD